MNKLEELKQLGAEVQCFCNGPWKGKWYVTASGKTTGVDLKCSATEIDLQVAIDIVYEKFMTYAPKTMRTPLLEAPSRPVTQIDDEISF